MPRMTVDFYCVEVAGDQDLADLLDALRRLPDGSDRAFDLGTKTIRLEEIRRRKTWWSGDFTRIRMRNLPTRARRDKKAQPLGLAPEEGVGESTSFAYCADSGVLMLERSLLGVTASAFQKFFQKSLHASITLLPVLGKGALQKMNGWDRVSKIEVKIARPNASLVKTGSQAVLQMTNLLRSMDAATLTLGLSVGRSRKASLRFQEFRAMVRELMNSGSSTERIVATGSVRSGRPEELNFLNERMCYKIDVEEDPDRFVTFDARAAALERAWHAMSKELEEVLA